MSDLRKAAEMALEALEQAQDCVRTNYHPGHYWEEAIQTLRQALAQPEEKMHIEGNGRITTRTYPYQYESEQEFREAIRKASAQPEQKPVLAGSLSVRYFRGDKAMTDTYFEYLGDLSEGDYTLYTAPPKREWVGLAKDEIPYHSYEDRLIIRWAEAKLKEKNT